MIKFAESTVETAALEWLAGLGYSVAAGPDLLVGLFAERPSASTVILGKRLGPGGLIVDYLGLADSLRKARNCSTMR